MGLTPLDRIQDLADEMDDWTGSGDWAHDLNVALSDLRPLIAAVEAFCSDSSPDKWTGDAARELHRAWQTYSSTPAENGGDRG